MVATGPMPIATIAIRVCPQLPPATEERIVDTRAANVADSAMYSRKQLVDNVARFPLA
jgi:hypothetical protein